MATKRESIEAAVTTAKRRIGEQAEAAGAAVRARLDDRLDGRTREEHPSEERPRENHPRDDFSLTKQPTAIASKIKGEKKDPTKPPAKPITPDMAKTLVKLGLPTLLITGGVACIAWGIRPKTRKERQAENLGYWSPPKMTMTAQQKSDVAVLAQEIEQLRLRIKAMWANPNAANLPSLPIVVSSADYAAAAANPNYPWRKPPVSMGTLKVNTKAAKYTTDLISPQLQAAYSTLDVALYLAGILNFPEQYSAANIASKLRTLNDAHVYVLAATFASFGGTYVKVIVNQNYETAAAREEEQLTKDELYGSGLLTWIALNTPISDLSAEERKRRKEIRQRAYRIPRTIIP